MTFAPPTLEEVADFWHDHGGRKLGIVGDTAHAEKGTSYHLGKSQLIPNAYSARLLRDKNGLSEAASAIDLGRLNDSLKELQRFSLWLVGQCQANAPGTRDIREISYSPDGRVTLHYDRQRGVASKAVVNPLISDHTRDTHISRYRDGEFRHSLLDIFKTYPPFIPPPVEDNVQTFATPTVPSVADVAQGAKLHTSSDLADAAPITIDPGRPMPYYGVPYKGVAMIQYTSDEPGNEPTGKVLFLSAASVSNIIPAPVPADPTPFSQTDLDAAHDAGEDAGSAAKERDVATRLGLDSLVTA